MKFLMDNEILIAALVLFFIGLYGIVSRRNIIKTIICISIMEVSTILFFLGINFKVGQKPPMEENLGSAVSDPLPQAMMITTIVIGIAVTAVALAMFSTLYHRYGTTNWKKAKDHKKEDV